MKSDISRLYDELTSSQVLAGLTPEEVVERIAKLIDASGDLGRDEGIALALDWCEAAETHGLSAAQGALVEYFRANAWGHRQSRKHRDSALAWEWEQAELQNQVWHLRRAVAHPGFDALPALQRCQILTNLGGQLSHIGRTFEAIESWGRAIAINPRFAMALGNRGYGLERCAASLYDTGHQNVYLWFAHEDLTAALSAQAVWDSPHYVQAKRSFWELKSRIEADGNVARVKGKTNLEKHSLGCSRAERRYRRWCLENKLFLNPLNDLGPYPIAGRDVLSLPTFRTPVSEPPTLVGFFSQMKQEFVSARWLFYDGLHSAGTHFSDRDVLLYNTLDYPSFCLAVEETKAAFRIAYSLLDKIAFFLNEYLRLKVPLNRVYLRTIWYENNDAKGRVLRGEFSGAENWPLRGLYWLTKDLFDESFRDVMEPDAQALNDIRNRAEHSYLKIHEIMVPPLGPFHSPELWDERLAYSVHRREFEAKTVRLFKLVRAAFLYLSLAMHREETIRNAGKNHNRAMPMDLILYEDVRKQ